MQQKKLFFKNNNIFTPLREKMIADKNLIQDKITID